MKNIIVIMALVIHLNFFWMPTPARGDSLIVNPPFSGPKYEVEGTQAEAFPSSGQLMVRGAIKNTDIRPVRGYVVIYFLDEGNDVIHIIETEVNKKRAIDSGKIGKFEVGTQTNNVERVTRVYVEFVKN